MSEKREIKIESVTFGGIASGELANANHSMRDQIVKRFALQCVQARERLYWRMLADGKLLSQGWTIGERQRMDGAVMHYECWPIAPNRI